MLFKEIRKNNGIVKKVLIFLIALYTLSIPFGTVFRTESETSLQPIVNLEFLTYAILVLTFIVVLINDKLKSNTVLNYLFFLAIYLLFNTLLFSNNILDNLIKWAGLFANIL